MTSEQNEAAVLIGEQVVVDTATPFVYIGTLKAWEENFIVLADADVHDSAEGRSGKDLYIAETRRNGVQRNRREVIIRKAQIVSLSLLEDVIVY